MSNRCGNDEEHYSPTEETVPSEEDLRMPLSEWEAWRMTHALDQAANADHDLYPWVPRLPPGDQDEQP